MLKQHFQVFVGLLCIADALMVVLASYAAWAVRRLTIEGFWPVSWENYLKEPLALFSVPVTLYAIWLVKLYRPRRDRSLISEQVQILKGSVAAICGLVVVLWFVGNDLVGNAGPYGSARVGPWALDPGHVQIGALALILPTLLVAERSLFRVVLRWLRRRGHNLRHVAVVGVGRLGQVACRTLERNSWTGLHVAYFVSHHDRTSRVECLHRPVHGGLDQLESTLRRWPVDAVYLAMPNSRAAELPAVLLTLEKFAVDVRIVPDVLPRLMPVGMVAAELDGMPILRYRESPFSGFGALTKRLLDLAGSGAGLILFSPLMLAIGVLVRLGGPGPVIFKQKRVSLGGRVFKIYKFRTMYHVEDEQGPARWTDRDDPRVTPVGRWLRATSLDELPQLLNVFKGQMSLVGPRPERPELIERFREDWRGYMLRQHVKAGMTGWAQVNGLRGNTSLRKRLQYDLYYIRNWSLGLDLRILWLTVFRGFIHRNAH